MSTAYQLRTDPIEGVCQFGGVDYDVITDLQAVQPFLMSVASVSDCWLYLGSQGGLTAGRRNPDHALFPYYTEDKLVDLRAAAGACTRIRIEGVPEVWRAAGSAEPQTGWVMKAVNGDEVVFGQLHPSGLELRQSWRLSPRYGVVRSCTLTNTGSEPRQLRVLDGWQGLLPAGTAQRTQNELSVLLDAYKRSEVTSDGFGVYSLSSALTDLAEPAESLEATLAWRLGPPADHYLVSAQQVELFERGGEIAPERDARGVRSAYLAEWRLRLAPGEASSWTVVADTGLDSAAVADLLADYRSGQLADSLAADLASARESLAELIAAADGYQTSGDRSAAAHHRSSVLFNLLRGGTFRREGRVTRAGFEAHLRVHNPGLARALADDVAALPESFRIGELLEWGRARRSADAERLTLTYLPLSFGRRHGDPSRPWNRFDIVVADPHGNPVDGFEGNWRDVFQNWEALSWSFPEYTESMIAVFLNATTIDGYNPYRITQAGIDWEEPEPENPWSNIGYWGDHQIVYLDRLLDLSFRRHPEALAGLLNRAVFATADVPYRIAGLDRILADPANTITFDQEANRRARQRAHAAGGDGLLRHTASGELFRTTLADKLLTLLGAKLVNFVPDGGIWMNTQRPEWNDANNALAGPGLSVVTLAQLLPFVAHLGALTAGQDVLIRPELAELLGELHQLLAADPGADPLTPAQRSELVLGLGRAGERYRSAAYASTDDGPVWFSGATLQSLLAASRRWLSRSVWNSRRSDGLFHSYNTISIGSATIEIRRLPLMLEGQVAVLGSGLLDPPAALALLQRLPNSELYRADQHSYLLYPDKELPGFLEKNLVPGSHQDAVRPLLADPQGRIVRADRSGGIHFAAGIKNARELSQRLAEVAAQGIEGDTAAVLAAYEVTFQHSSFTGRSGTFFAYEGLGSIYWHMVSKLVLAAREAADAAAAAGAPQTAELLAAYRELRSGLGYAKDAVTFGAFPTDAYSHTPRHSGARQPGMTGQVKEDVITRFAELGVSVTGGEVVLRSALVAAPEWLPEAAELSLPGRAGVSLERGQLGFTLCGVPVIYRSPAEQIRVELDSGEVIEAALSLPRGLTRQLFARDGSIRKIVVG